MKRYKVTICYEIEVVDSINQTEKEIQEKISDRVNSLGYGANHFWRLDLETIKVRVTKKLFGWL
ncbi:MAG TPA: hypothetical protein VI423_09935 [Paenisporosarcina sp.]|nr:hypothetical protein [Paenisporosarcina sp.]